MNSLYLDGIFVLFGPTSACIRVFCLNFGVPSRVKWGSHYAKNPLWKGVSPFRTKSPTGKLYNFQTSKLMHSNLQTMNPWHIPIPSMYGKGWLIFMVFTLVNIHFIHGSYGYIYIYKTSKISVIFWTPRSTKSQTWAMEKVGLNLGNMSGMPQMCGDCFRNPWFFGSLLNNHYKIPIKPPAHKRKRCPSVKSLLPWGPSVLTWLFWIADLRKLICHVN